MSDFNRYGTTSDMIIQQLDDHGITRLIAIDAKGLYLTSPDRVGRLTADVNRYGVPRDLFLQQLEELGLDPKQLFESNKHLIGQNQERQTKEKILNPIKASKRR